MSELMEGPFADKLKQAIAGHKIPAAPVVLEQTNADSVVSGGQKPKAERTPAKNEKAGQRDGGESVSSRAIHQRGGAGTGAEASGLGEVQMEDRNEQEHNPRALMTRIDEAHALLMKLKREHPEVEVEIGVDGQNFWDSIETDFEQAQQSAASYLKPGNVSEVSHSDVYLDAIDTLRTVQVNFEDYIRDIRAGIESNRQTEEDRVSPEPNQLSTVGHLKPKRRESGAAREESPGRVKGMMGLTKKKRTGVEHDEAIEGQLARLKELLERWKVLEAEFSEGHLRSATRAMAKRENKTLPSVRRAADWLNLSPEKWRKGGREDFQTVVLPEIEALVGLAEEAAQELRRKRKKRQRGSDEPGTKTVTVETPKAGPAVALEATAAVSAGEPAVAEDQPEPTSPPEPARSPSNVAEIRTGRPISGPDDLTHWERMNIVEQNRYRHELRRLKAEFLDDVSEQLRAHGTDPAELTDVISQSLQQYLREAIRVTIPNVELTASDTEGLVAELMGEEPMTKPE